MNKLLWFVSLIFLPLTSNYAEDYKNLNIENCYEDTGLGPYVYRDDFSWHLSLEEVLNLSKSIYSSKKRLQKRAYYNGKDVVMPLNVLGEYRPVKLSSRFLESIQKHIEVSYRRGYIDAVIFPDMGHSHFFIPNKVYNEILKPIPVKQKDKKYELMINHPELKILYHTAEQLQLLDEFDRPLEDRNIQWRFFTRNLVGDNQALGRMELLHNAESSYNTSREYDDNHRYWGAGFNLSASAEGCFVFVKDNKKHYFDLSFDDLRPSTSK